MGCCGSMVAVGGFFFPFDFVVFSGNGGDGFGGLVVTASRGFDGQKSVKCLLYYYLMVDLNYFNGLNLKIETEMQGEL